MILFLVFLIMMTVMETCLFPEHYNIFISIDLTHIISHIMLSITHLRCCLAPLRCDLVLVLVTLQLHLVTSHSLSSSSVWSGSGVRVSPYSRLCGVILQKCKVPIT